MKALKMHQMRPPQSLSKILNILLKDLNDTTLSRGNIVISAHQWLSIYQFTAVCLKSPGKTFHKEVKTLYGTGELLHLNLAA